MPSIPLAKGWSLKPGDAPTKAQYLLATALGLAGMALGLQLNHPLLPCIAAVFLASYVSGLGPGLLASSAMLIGLYLPGYAALRTSGLFEIVITCALMAWSVSRFRHSERVRDAATKKLDDARLTLDRIPVGT